MPTAPSFALLRCSPQHAQSDFDLRGNPSIERMRESATRAIGMYTAAVPPSCSSALKLTRNFHSGLLIVVKNVYIPSRGDVQQRVDSDREVRHLGMLRFTRERSDFSSLVAAFLCMPIDSPIYRAAASLPSFLWADHVTNPQAHWNRDVSNMKGAFLAGLPRRERTYQRQRSVCCSMISGNGCVLIISTMSPTSTVSRRMPKQCRCPSRIPDPQTESARDGFVNGLIRRLWRR